MSVCLKLIAWMIYHLALLLTRCSHGGTPQSLLQPVNVVINLGVYMTSQKVKRVRPVL